MGGGGPSKHLLEWKNTGKYFTYGEHQIFYKDEQNPDSQTTETVVCLHGWPTCSYDYREVWDAFRGKFRRVIAIDYLGMGFSSKPTDHDYTFGGHADYIEALLVDIGVTQFHLAARALSNATCGELLRRFELRQLSAGGGGSGARPGGGTGSGGAQDALEIRSISFTNGYVFPDVYSPSGGHEGTSVLTGGCGPCAARILPYGVFKTLLSRIYGSETQLTEQELRDYWFAMNYNSGRRAQPKFLAFVDEWLETGEKWVDVYRETRVPLQDIHGPAGPVIRIQDFEPRWRRHFPQARLDVLAEHVGHFVQTEDPHGFLAAYFSFIDSVISRLYPTLR